jgi:hypothetical protein
MRCPTCGTQNEQDSRFCGGCGAKMTPTIAPSGAIVTVPTTVPGVAQSKVAPTQKVLPDQRIDAMRGAAQASPALAAPARSHPPSMPPPAVAPTPMVPQPIMNPQVITPHAALPAMHPSPVPAAMARPSPQADFGRQATEPVSRSTPQTIQRPSNSGVPTVPRPVAPAAAARSAQVSMPPRRGRNVTLIVFVVIFDLVLAVFGALMLQRGLVRDDEVPATHQGTP